MSSCFQRAYENRMSKNRGERPKCFECGEIGHFIAECPNNNNNYYKKGKNYSRDSDSSRHHSRDSDKYRSSKRDKELEKKFKSFLKDNRRREKVFLAEVSERYTKPATSSTSSSSVSLAPILLVSLLC